MKGEKQIGKLVSKSMFFIKNHRPRVTVFENAATLINKKFLRFTNGVVKCLIELGYSVDYKVLDSHHFGAPAVRKRLYIVAIRNDSLRHKFAWPVPLADSAKATVASILDPFRSSDKPGRLPKSKRGQDRTVTAYVQAWKKGVDARKTPIMVDIDCSQKYQVWGIGVAKTLTRARGLVGGPWVSTRGRRTTIRELLRLQGSF